MKPPPPGPATNGTVTPNALAVATAASTALPPCFSTSMPAWLASTSMDATAPPEPTATGCLTGSGGAWPAARAPAGTASKTAASADTAAATGKRRMSTSGSGHLFVCSMLVTLNQHKNTRSVLTRHLPGDGAGPHQLDQ